MAYAPSLFAERQTWYHYVGGTYASPEAFLREARAQGISRRVPLAFARAFRFGDRVVLLRWLGKDRGVQAFAEFTVSSVVLQGETSKAVGDLLREQGRAEWSDAGAGKVERECGSYFVGGCWLVQADLSEIVQLAFELGGDFCMIGGGLSAVYPEPVLLDPAPPFTRSFLRVPDGEATFFYQGGAEQPDRSIVSISGYRRA